jgi:hypothetical protein
MAHAPKKTKNTCLSTSGKAKINNCIANRKVFSVKGKDEYERQNFHIE